MKRVAMLGVSVAVTLTAMLAADGKRADVLFQAGMAKETVQGDIKGAIAQYEQAVKEAGADRAIAAKALVRMAGCYEKLGDTESKKIYERLIRDYTDQAEPAAFARARLGDRKTVGSTTGVLARQLWTTRGYTQVTIAPDGRTAAVAGSESQDIQIRDLVTGQAVPFKVTTDPASGEYAEWPVLSPDLKQVAYAWAGPETNWNYQLRVSAMQPGAKPKPLGNLSPYLYVRAWSADGKSVLVSIFGEGNSQIAWISTTDGTLRTLKSLDWQRQGVLALSPDGRFIAYDVLVEPGKPDREIRVLASDATSESIVVRAPGINESPVWSRDGKRLVFKSNRSGTFGMWSVPVLNSQSEGPPTLLKTDVGDGRLIGFSATGALLYEQRVNARDVFAMDLDPQQGTLRGTRTRLVDTFVGSNLNPSASPDGKSVAYLSQRTQGLSGNWAHLVIRSLETGAERVIPTIFRGGGKPLWLPDGQSLIEVGRNGQNHTALYKVDLTSGEVVPLIDTGASLPQSAALSPDGRTAYVGSLSRDVPSRHHLAAYDLASGRRTDVRHAGTSRGIAASPDGRSVAFIASEDITPPFRAYIYVADADGGNVRTVLTADRVDGSPATMNLAWSADSRFIYFLRRNKGSLWRVAAAGGSPSLVGELSTDVVGTIDISADGKRVFYGAGGPPTIEVWAIENLQPALKLSR
jgi:Tol biopolymer transport system component